MAVLYLILMVVACFCFLCTALGVRARIDLLGAGLFCWALVSVISMFDALT
jgi:hypothetical protein